jgi:hypothetical protein
MSDGGVKFISDDAVRQAKGRKHHRSLSRLIGGAGTVQSGYPRDHRYDLGATRPADDLIHAEWHARCSQSFDLRVEIGHLEVNPVPAAGYLTPPIGEGPLS